MNEFKHIRGLPKKGFHRIAWASLKTGAEGHGDWFDRELSTLKLVCKEMNRQYPELDHWIEYWNRRCN